MQRRWISLLLPVLVLSLVVPVAAQDDEDQRTVEFENISFTYDASLAEGVVAELISSPAFPEGEEDSVPYWARIPGHTQFLFTDYIILQGEALHEPQINIYPVEEFEQWSEDEYGAQAQLEQLQDILAAEEPDFADYALADTSSEDNLPFLPLFNAAQVMRLQPQVITFDGGRGIRYLAYYSQSLNVIEDGDIFYTFQGISDDGEIYVSMLFPVFTGVLPTRGSTDYEELDYDAFAEEYELYLEDTAEQIQNQSTDAFTPPLTTLDAVVESLKIESE